MLLILTEFHFLFQDECTTARMLTEAPECPVKTPDGTRPFQQSSAGALCYDETSFRTSASGVYTGNDYFMFGFYCWDKYIWIPFTKC